MALSLVCKAFCAELWKLGLMFDCYFMTSNLYDCLENVPIHVLRVASEILTKFGPYVYVHDA